MSTASSALIPKDFCRVQYFLARELFQQTPDGWVPAEDGTTATLQEQVDEWATRTRNRITTADSPRTEVMFLDDEKTIKCFLTSAAVCYIPAVEGAADKKHEQPAARPRLTPPTRKPG